jgi:hypothetical protein
MLSLPAELEEEMVLPELAVRAINQEAVVQLAHLQTVVAVVVVQLMLS